MTFKLPDFRHDGYLNSLRTQMGAPLSASFEEDIDVKPIQLPDIQRRLREEGVDVDPDEVRVLADGTLAFGDNRVIVYIRDVSSNGDRQSMPRYHLSHCDTLRTMRANNRWRRYVVANRDDGLFQVNVIDGAATRSQMAKLVVCQNCLVQVGWQGFSYALAAAHRAAFVSRFRLPDFFAHYPRDLFIEKPEQTSDSAPLNTYPANWPDVSEARKRSAGYRCEGCGTVLNLRGSRFLHVHHRNGEKHDCRESNLAVLCIRCHADQPLHSHMRSLPDYIEYAGTYAR